MFTSVAFHETKAKAVKLTWGKRCDGLLFMSDWADPAVPSIVLKNVKEDSFDNLWHKMQHALVELQENYSDKYDWFYKADDDSYALIENLRSYLLSPEIKAVEAKGHGAFVGRRMNNTRALVGPSPREEEITFYNGGK